MTSESLMPLASNPQSALQGWDGAMPSSAEQQLSLALAPMLARLLTLCLGPCCRWNERFIEAKLSMVDRAAKVDAVSEQVEKDLRLLGCTAIEDKLQEGVPQCIKTLAEAGIRLWVLTGDKMVGQAVHVASTKTRLCPARCYLLQHYCMCSRLFLDASALWPGQ